MTMTPDELILFLRARLDEDEAAARAAADNDREREKGTYGRGGSQWVAPIRHAWEELGVDPARVLREVAAKRAILTYEDRNGLPGINAWGVWRDMLKYLAAAYSDHPDYQASWVMSVS